MSWLPAGSFCPCVWRALAVPFLPNGREWREEGGDWGESWREWSEEGDKGEEEADGGGGVELPKGGQHKVLPPQNQRAAGWEKSKKRATLRA